MLPRKLIEWRREQLALKLADLEQHASKWRWSFKPSDHRFYEKRIARAERRLARFNEKHPEEARDA